jgi:hypothetical protein
VINIEEKIPVRNVLRLVYGTMGKCDVTPFGLVDMHQHFLPPPSSWQTCEDEGSIGVSPVSVGSMFQHLPQSHDNTHNTELYM